ncbi:hypothetical protein FALBO_5727 [Fusarium albosuccineum]|uniref:Aminoglycoside phosphotransferase domain-containing protein n=1 Tax=Fusarium albosuccineum TaxID=1237068 RepID=A0A8H4PKB1_9HYPO|nr:hypothetical protein FALBO_5727 [Fusarium albosuccineum]
MTAAPRLRGVGKCAVGISLLRIVRNKIHKGFIWAFLAGTVFITLFASITVVVPCIPVEKTWNPTVPGKCWLDFSKVGLTVGSWFVVADFSFAILPWFVIWDLNMKRKEKITVACGLSLGVFAGICGIVRTVALNGLNAQEYIHDTVPMLIWSATESLVTIMCSSIPVLRPLYVRFKYGSKGDSSGASGANSSYKLPMYGNHSGRRYGQGSTAGIDPPAPSHQTQITYNANNASDESILRDTKAQYGISSAIKRTDEVSTDTAMFRTSRASNYSQSQSCASTDDDGSWLSAPGPYQDIVKSLCKSWPSLRSRDRLNPRQWPPRQMIYIVEGLSPTFIGLLGEHFMMHPSFFADQLWISSRSAVGQGLDSVPSAICTKEQNITAVILCDPPPRVMMNGIDKQAPNLLPWAGGYNDFLPFRDQMECLTGPPRTSMLDDLCYYLKNHSRHLALEDPHAPAFFAKKIIWQHFLQNHDIFKALIMQSHFHICGDHDLSAFDPDKQWGEGQSCEFNLLLLCSNLTRIMGQLGIPRDVGTVGGLEDWKDTAADFKAIHAQFQNLLRQVRAVNSSSTDFVSISNAKQAEEAQNIALRTANFSALEAKRARALVLVGNKNIAELCPVIFLAKSSQRIIMETSKEKKLPSLRKMSYLDAAYGKEIYNFFGNRVLEHTTSTGAVLAIKVKPLEGMDRSEADMMQYAATNGILAPNVRGVYEVVTSEPIARVLVSERVPGESLDGVWPNLTEIQRSSSPRCANTYCGPFSDEKEFDDWCLDQLDGGPLARWRWQRYLKKERKSSPGRFVLTHGDLTPRNIMVQDGTVTGIIDWEKSGFFPEYAEYAFAFALCHTHEKWWMPVLKEILQPCSGQRLELTRLTENRGF